MFCFNAQRTSNTLCHKNTKPIKIEISDKLKLKKIVQIATLSIVLNAYKGVITQLSNTYIR